MLGGAVYPKPSTPKVTGLLLAYRPIFFRGDPQRAELRFYCQTNFDAGRRGFTVYYKRKTDRVRTKKNATVKNGRIIHIWH